MAWEYLVFPLTDHDWAAQIEELNSYGVDGWELAAVAGGVAYLKRLRPIEGPPPRP